jgi:hypothetical protein
VGVPQGDEKHPPLREQLKTKCDRSTLSSTCRAQSCGVPPGHSPSNSANKRPRSESIAATSHNVATSHPKATASQNTQQAKASTGNQPGKGSPQSHEPDHSTARKNERGGAATDPHTHGLRLTWALLRAKRRKRKDPRSPTNMPREERREVPSTGKQTASRQGAAEPQREPTSHNTTARHHPALRSTRKAKRLLI